MLRSYREAYGKPWPKCFHCGQEVYEVDYTKFACEQSHMKCRIEKHVEDFIVMAKRNSQQKFSSNAEKKIGST